MQYNGKELVAMVPEKWDGKTREMLVWSDFDEKPSLALVCGFTTKGYALVDTGKKESAYNYVISQYCADIPKAEPNQAQNIDEMIKILNAYKEGKTIEFKYGREICDSWSRINSQNPDWNWTIFEYRIANDNQTKKPRRMTNKELFKWLAQGNGAMRWSKHERAQLTTHFEYDEYQEKYPVASGIIIRGFDEAEWHDPVVYE